jgi:isopenicillin-N N-acyltransferase-like protein
VSTSSAVTLLGPQGAVTVELSPHGAAVVHPTDGILLHTNHFLNPALARGEKPGLYDPDSQLRLRMLVERTRDRSTVSEDAVGLVPLLVSHPGDPADLCCVPVPGATLGDRWATLATVSLDVANRRLTVSAGSPVEAQSASRISLQAAEFLKGRGLRV